MSYFGEHITHKVTEVESGNDNEDSQECSQQVQTRTVKRRNSPAEQSELLMHLKKDAKLNIEKFKRELRAKVAEDLQNFCRDGRDRSYGMGANNGKVYGN